MSKQSGYLKRLEDERNRVMNATELLTKQFMLDTLQITMNRQKDAWGFDRLMRLMDDWEKVRHEYKAAMDPKDPEADVAQEHMDREIAGIINGRMDLIPFYERYPELRRIVYDKRR